MDTGRSSGYDCGVSNRWSVAVEGAIYLPREMRGRWPVLARDWLGHGVSAVQARSEFVAFILQTAKYEPLYRIFPNLSSNVQIPYERAPVRVRNCFLHARRLVTWGDFCDTTIETLLSVRSAGVLSVSAFLDLALVEAIILHEDDFDAVSASHQTADSTIRDVSKDTVGRSLLELRVGEVAQWATSRRSSSTFGDIFTIRPEIAPIPDDLQAVLEDLYALPLEFDAIPDEDPLEILSVFSEEERAIFFRRNLAQKSFRTVANDFDVSGEAIRLKMQRAEKTLAKALESDAHRSLRWLIPDLRKSLGLAYPVNSLADIKELAPWLHDTRRTEFLLWMAGPYRQSDGWLTTDGILVSELKDYVVTLCDLNNAPTVLELVAALSERGIVERAGKALINDSDRFRVIDGQVFFWGRTIAERTVTVLSLFGRPATDQEIFHSIGGVRSLQSLRNRLMEDPRFMRTDRHHFALREWNLEEYSGISEEIAERIHRAGGVAILEDVIHEILSTFTVSESAVRQYAAAHRFVTRNGQIWLRTDEAIEVRQSNPLYVAGTFQPKQHRLRYVVEVTADTLRGSGRGLPRPLAVALGVTPGLRKEYISNDGELLRIAWRINSAGGPDIGSLSSFCVSEQAAIGDLLVFDFDTTGFKLDVVVVTAEMSINEQVARLTGIDHPNPYTALAKALGVHEGAVRATLRRRGDDVLVDSLPECEVDPPLKDALNTLADALKDSV